ncbi:MAG: electron transfer flavoprotein subunit alpha/FixB family protein, partial [Ferruginibacter sp.]
MSVLVFIDQSEGHIKKSSFEAAAYAAALAQQIGTSAEGIILGNSTDNLSNLGHYGLKKVHTISTDSLNQMDAQVYTAVIAEAVQQLAAKVVVFSNNINGKSIAPRLSARL